MEDKKLFPGINYKELPEGLRGGVERYLEHGILPGDFLRAVICNDLKLAVGRADDNNKGLLPEIILFFYNEVPSSCWGSGAAMRAWVFAVKTCRENLT